MKLIEELRKYGLSERESKVYLSLLKLGEVTVNSIAEDCDLIRTTTYDLLKSLKERGLVSLTIKNKVYYFSSANPNKLIQVLNEKRRIIEEILPELQNLKKVVSEIPRAEVFEGEEGLKTVFQTLLNKKQTLYAFSNNQAMVELLPYFAPNFIKQRSKAKVPIKIISEPSETTSELLTGKDKEELRETRVLEDMKKIKLNEYIGEDSVAILSSRAEKPVGIIIHHKDFAQEQRILFEKIWKIAKP
jgi:sugar-specific transcriptional regulator TrmB